MWTGKWCSDNVHNSLKILNKREALLINGDRGNILRFLQYPTMIYHHNWCPQINHLNNIGQRPASIHHWIMLYFESKCLADHTLLFFLLIGKLMGIFRYLEFTVDYVWSTNEVFIWAFWEDYTATWSLMQERDRVKESEYSFRRKTDKKITMRTMRTVCKNHAVCSCWTMLHLTSCWIAARVESF